MVFDLKGSSEILVAGGAGYIGSHCVKLLIECGYNVVVIDNLVNGHKESIVKGATFYNGDISDPLILHQIFRKHRISSVIHFAAFAYVGASVLDPLSYYLNNLSAPIILLGVLKEYGCKKIVFSSTCATYGAPESACLNEDTPQIPINPYGHSKAMFEQVLKDAGKAWGLEYVILRYFNAAGCSFDSTLGEDHDPEPHLIPKVLMAARGDYDHICVYGDDYNTYDGTCVRDYIHVEDLSSAHLKALQYLLGGGGSNVFNLGGGVGTSVKQVIQVAEEVTGRPIPIVYSSRREGDPAYLVADITKSREVLGWEAKNSDMKIIIKSAWNWFSNERLGRY